MLQGDPRIKHCTFHRYKWRLEKFLHIFDQGPFTTCALIRHPQDWLGSWYRYRQGAWLDGTPQSTKGLSFDQFVEGYLAEQQPAFAAVGAQARFLTHPKTGATVDHLFRYDAFEHFRTIWRTGWGRGLRWTGSMPRPSVPCRCRRTCRTRCERPARLISPCMTQRMRQGPRKWKTNPVSEPCKLSSFGGKVAPCRRVKGHVMPLEDRIAAARGERKADLVLRGAQTLCMVTGARLTGRCRHS